VRHQLEGSFDALIDGGTCRVGVESTVLSLTGETPELLRAGGLSLEDIEAVIGPVRHQGRRETVGEAAAPGTGREKGAGPGSERGPEKDPGASPGLLPDHYAPVTPLVVTDNVEMYRYSSSAGKLLFSGSGEGFSGPTLVLSESGDVREAAVKLYHSIQLLDTMELDLIVAEPAPNHGLGRAVNDRLKKASRK
jgi:L-threonylcarbamoyladenylate synthase